MMIRNLPASFTKRELMAELDSAGFGDQYDYVYVPRDLTTGQGKGFAFVNFTTAAKAAELISGWAPTKVDPSVVNVAPSSVQGFAENYRQWKMKKGVIRDPQFRPFFRFPGKKRS
jgi:hypothetical protein